MKDPKYQITVEPKKAKPGNGYYIEGYILGYYFYYYLLDLPQNKGTVYFSENQLSNNERIRSFIIRHAIRKDIKAKQRNHDWKAERDRLETEIMAMDGKMI